MFEKEKFTLLEIDINHIGQFSKVIEKYLNINLTESIHQLKQLIKLDTDKGDFNSVISYSKSLENAFYNKQVLNDLLSNINRDKELNSPIQTYEKSYVKISLYERVISLLSDIFSDEYHKLNNEIFTETYTNTPKWDEKYTFVVAYYQQFLERLLNF